MSEERPKLPCEGNSECMGLVVRESDGPITREGLPFTLEGTDKGTNIRLSHLLDEIPEKKGCANANGCCINTMIIQHNLEMIRAGTLAVCPYLDPDPKLNK